MVYQNWQILGVHLRKPIDPPLHKKIVDNNIFDALSIFNARKSIPIIPNLQEPTIDLHTPFYLDLNDKFWQINKTLLANFKDHSQLCTIFYNQFLCRILIHGFS